MVLLHVNALGQTTYADNFSTQNYNLNDGSGTWTNGWIETNDNGSPSSGDIFISPSFGSVLGFIGDGANGNGGHGINREVNLNGATSATLSFDWRTQALDTFALDQEELGIFMSNDGGATYTQIASGTIVGNNTGTVSEDISGFISANTVFRLQVIGGNQIFESDNNVTEFAYIDNLVITAFFGPSVTVIDQTVNEDAGTITVTAQLTGGNVLFGFSVDYSTADNTAYADSDYTTSSGTLTFLGIDNETQTFTIPIIDNTFGENTETFFVNLSNISNTSVNEKGGTITIIDDGDPAVPDDVPLTLFDEFDGYYDYALTAGTLRTNDEDVDACSITTSSSNTLTTPILAGSTIEKAYLVWGHSGFAADDVVTFEGQSIAADVINSAEGGFFYGMVADITPIIQGIPDPSTNVFDFSDLKVDNSSTYCGTVVFGGWSLFIFYTNPTLPAVSINMYNGYDGQSGSVNNQGNVTPVSTSYTLDGFYAIGSTGSKTSVLSWEGDRLRAGDEIISVTTTTGTTNLTGDGNNSAVTENVFNSTIYDNTSATTINDSSLYGFDLDTYDISALISQGETSATTNIQTGSDLIILNSVLLKVPSNLITGTVFEDLNYPGGSGRNLTTSNGVGIPGVTVELYDNSGNYLEANITDADGVYSFGGMENGTYTTRVVNSTVQSTRGGGNTCTTCLPIQTFRSEFAASTLAAVTNEVGGTDPAAQSDSAATVLTGAQTVSTVTINSEGAVNVNFGYNFNTVVNTNSNGQGSLEQFIINSNNLDETGLDIEAHPNNASLNPAAGEDVSIFMIPTASDPLGRTVDARFNGHGFFDILIPNASELSSITDSNTHIDGRTQTAYSGETNPGIVGVSGTSVGISDTPLPDFNQPEIQIRQNNGVDNYVLNIEAENIVIRNTAIYANFDSGVRMTSGSSSIIENFIGLNANGTFTQNIDYGIEILGGTILVDSNYIADNTVAGIFINGGTSSTIQNNQITQNGRLNNAATGCGSNILITGGANITIQQNLVESAQAIGIEDTAGNLIINENTITNSGTRTECTNNSGFQSSASNSSITNNVIYSNAGAGIVLTGTTSGNTISQNSIYTNGTLNNALGIDINQDGVSINDNGDGDIGANGTLNFPIIETSIAAGSVLRVTGWARPGAIVEFFLTDVNEGTATLGDNQLGLSKDYGEGQVFLGSATEGSIDDTNNTTSSYTDNDGNTDDTNKFNFNLTLASTIPIGSVITATTTVSGSTSEFSPSFITIGVRVITNRFVTYRVTPITISP